MRKKINIPKEGMIDVVYIWCNSSDSDYIKNRNFYSKQYNLNKYWSETRDHDEILYSIKSVRKYMSWVRNIYICTPKNHSIKGLDIKKYNVKYIINEDILGNENCPNFNSHSLELFTHKINGLSEYFIQFNDDFFINNYIELENFYNFKTNKIKYYYENILCLGTILSDKTQEIIFSLTGDKYYFWPTHSPRMFCKSDVKEIINLYTTCSEITKKSKFRNKNDLQLVYLYGYFLLSKNKGDFIFLNNVIKTKFYFNFIILFRKIFIEGLSSTIKQIYLQFFYKKKLLNNKIFFRNQIYSLINLSNDYIYNKLNIDYVFENNVKFICLNDSYKTLEEKTINNINKENYTYFYNKLLKEGKK